MKTPIPSKATLPLLVLAGLSACSSHSAKPAAKAEASPAKQCNGDNASPDIACALSPAVAFDTKGRLLAAWEQGGKVYLSHSNDLGKSFSAPVAANPAAEAVVGSGAGRPKIALSKAGAVYLAWNRGQPDTGEIRFSRSLDGGRTFAAPLSVGTGTAQAVAVNDRDYVYLAWIAGAEPHFAYSSDGGRSFHADKRIAGQACPDSGPALKIEAKKFPVILWQETAGHALTHFTAKEQPGPVLPVSPAGCKGHAGQSLALAVGPQGEYYAAWTADGVYFSASLDHGRSFSPPAKISPATTASQAELLADGPLLHLAWTESDGQKTALRGQYSSDAGLSWSPPANVAETTGEAGQPVLLGYQGRHYAAWQTRGQGFKLIALD